MEFENLEFENLVHIPDPTIPGVYVLTLVILVLKMVWKANVEIGLVCSDNM